MSRRLRTRDLEHYELRRDRAVAQAAGRAIVALGRLAPAARTEPQYPPPALHADRATDAALRARLIAGGFIRPAGRDDPEEAA